MNMTFDKLVYLYGIGQLRIILIEEERGILQARIKELEEQLNPPKKKDDKADK